MESWGPKYPRITAVLSGTSDNAYSIPGLTKNALHLDGVPQAEVDAYMAEAKEGDYDHLIQTTMKWVNVE